MADPGFESIMPGTLLLQKHAVAVCKLLRGHFLQPEGCRDTKATRKASGFQAGSTVRGGAT